MAELLKYPFRILTGSGIRKDRRIFRYVRRIDSTANQLKDQLIKVLSRAQLCQGAGGDMFKVSRQTLDLIERKDELTVSDVGGLVRDLFRDILKEQGMEFAELPSGDPVEAAGDIVMIMQQMRKLHRKNDEIFSQERYRERWENASRGLDEAQRELEAVLEEEKAHADSAVRLREIKEKTENARLNLEEEKQKLELAEAELEALLKKSRDMDALIEEKKKESARCLNELIPEKENELKRADEDLSKAEQRLAEAKQEYEMLQDQVKGKLDELLSLRQLWDKVLGAYERDELLFGPERKGSYPAGVINERYARIREEMEAFRQDYARAAGILKRT